MEGAQRQNTANSAQLGAAKRSWQLAKLCGAAPEAVLVWNLSFGFSLFSNWVVRRRLKAETSACLKKRESELEWGQGVGTIYIC